MDTLMRKVALWYVGEPPGQMGEIRRRSLNLHLSLTPIAYQRKVSRILNGTGKWSAPRENLLAGQMASHILISPYNRLRLRAKNGLLFDHFAVFHDELNFLQNRYISKRVAFDGNQVRLFAGTYGAELSLLADQVGSPDGR